MGMSKAQRRDRKLRKAARKDEKYEKCLSKGKDKSKCAKYKDQAAKHTGKAAELDQKLGSKKPARARGVKGGGGSDAGQRVAGALAAGGQAALQSLEAQPPEGETEELYAEEGEQGMGLLGPAVGVVAVLGLAALAWKKWGR
jgi:hypothetical protein